MSLSKGLSAALLLFKRPAGWLKVALERAGGREDEGARKDDDYDDDDDLFSTMTMTMTMTL